MGVHSNMIGRFLSLKSHDFIVWLPPVSLCCFVCFFKHYSGPWVLVYSLFAEAQTAPSFTVILSWKCPNLQLLPIKPFPFRTPPKSGNFAISYLVEKSYGHEDYYRTLIVIWEQSLGTEISSQKQRECLFLLTLSPTSAVPAHGRPGTLWSIVRANTHAPCSLSGHRDVWSAKA